MGVVMRILLSHIPSVTTAVLACTLTLATQLAAQESLPDSIPGVQSVSVNASDWPWWRGPERNGHASQKQSFVTKFGDSENVLWKVPVPGRGHCSPTVVDGKVFLSSADEASQIQGVFAYDLATGKRLWQRPLSKGGFPAGNHPKNTEASSTIASDGKSLFVTFFHHKRVVLSALSLGGKPLWEAAVSAFDPKKYEYGYAPSPLIYKDFVIVSAEHDGPSAIVAFDRKTGKVRWRAPRKANITFSSPVIANVSGKDQLLISGSDQVTSYDPNSGQQLWTVRGTTAATCGTMVWDGDLVFASGGYPRAQTLAVAADGSGRVVWSNQQKCYEQSMIVVDGYLYGLTDKGIMYCWRTSDGNEMWRYRLHGKVSASPVFAGGHIYWANEGGTVFVFKPNPTRFELVSENRLGNESFASPAISDGKMLFRVAAGQGESRQEYLYCVGQ